MQLKTVIKKSIKLGKAYVEVAVYVRQNMAKEAMYKWYYLTAERIKAKEAIQIEIEQQKQLQILEFEREKEEKNKIQQFASELYSLNLIKRAFKSLQMNMAPRKKVIKRLIQKYRLERLKSKSIQALRDYVKIRKIDRQ